jgi:hypothetical protein
LPVGRSRVIVLPVDKTTGRRTGMKKKLAILVATAAMTTALAAGPAQ